MKMSRMSAAMIAALNMGLHHPQLDRYRNRPEEPSWDERQAMYKKLPKPKPIPKFKHREQSKKRRGWK